MASEKMEIFGWTPVWGKEKFLRGLGDEIDTLDQGEVPTKSLADLIHQS